MTHNDNIYKLFEDFNPPMGPQSEFTNSVEQKMKAIDLLKDDLKLQRKTMRRAMLIACLAGFIAGCVCTLAAPAFVNVFHGILLNSSSYLPQITSINLNYISWIIIAAISTGVSIGIYNLVASIPRRA